MMDADAISKKLAEINSRLPKMISKNIIQEVSVTPTVKFVVEQAMSDPDFPADKKEKLKTLYELGDFSKKKIVENKKFAKMADQWMAREINKAIKKGELPHPSQIKDLPHVKELYQKVLKEKHE